LEKEGVGSNKMDTKRTELGRGSIGIGLQNISSAQNVKSEGAQLLIKKVTWSI
jgi:hypothetical protein